MASSEEELAGEIEILEAVYGDALTVGDSTPPGTKVITVRLGSEDGVQSTTEEGVRFTIFVSPAYPGEMPPFELKGVNWKVFDQSALYEGLQQIRDNQEGGPFLYQWVDHVKEFLSSHVEFAEDEPEEEEALRGEESWREYERALSEEQQSTTEEPEFDIIHGETLTDRRSVFQAHLARIKSEREAMAVLEVLKRDKKVARATHNMYAFRVFDVDRQAQVNDNDDDGENAAGGKMAELLAMMGVNDVIVVVSRWYGGIQLGPDRFRHINNVAREILERNGFERKGAPGGGKSIGPKSKK